MKRILVLALALAAAALIFAQQQKTAAAAHVPFEVLSVFPHETSPGFYEQVKLHELQTVADQGWELVGVTPYIYRNEERGAGNPKAMVTQTYSAYFFKCEAESLSPFRLSRPAHRPKAVCEVQRRQDVHNTYAEAR
ncbi:MAG: hypothetical protein ABJC09_03955 [Terriglobia bacterium]